MFITRFVLTDFRNNYIKEIGSGNRRKNVTGIKGFLRHCGAFHQINKVKEIRATIFHAKLAPCFDINGFVKWHVIMFYTYCTIISIYIKYTYALSSITSIAGAGALSICFYLQRNSLWEMEAFSLQGNLS